MATKTIHGKTKGRPPGSKTRADAPSKLKRQKALRDAAGHFLKPAIPVTHPDAPAPAPEPAAPAPAAPAAPLPPLESRPDTDLFGTVPAFSGDAPEATPGEATPGENPAAGEATPGENPAADDLPPQDTPEIHRPLASAIWDGIINITAMMIGFFWYPRPCGTDAAKGEIPYDEREMVISAFCKYFHSIGMKALSPVQELWLAIGAYCSPRLVLTVRWFKAKFAKKKPAPEKPPVAGDNRFAENAKPAPTASNPATKTAASETPHE